MAAGCSFLPTPASGDHSPRGAHYAVDECVERGPLRIELFSLPEKNEPQILLHVFLVGTSKSLPLAKSSSHHPDTRRGIFREYSTLRIRATHSSLRAEGCYRTFAREWVKALCCGASPQTDTCATDCRFMSLTAQSGRHNSCGIATNRVATRQRENYVSQSIALGGAYLKVRSDEMAP